MKRHILSALALVSVNAMAHASTITIAAGDAVQTINEYARQADVNLVYEATDIVGAGFRTNAISNETDHKIALDHLLIDSGLHAVWSYGVLGLQIDESHKRIIFKGTHARPTPKPPAPLLQPEGCTACARSIRGFPLGPWCWGAADDLIYAPAACGNST